MTDEQLLRNLDTQSKRLDEIESTLRALLDGRTDLPSLPVPETSRPQSYPQLTADNEQLRLARDWTTIDLDAALTPEERAAFDRWRTSTRIAWSTADLMAVGITGAIGVLMTWLDHQVDHAVLQQLRKLGDTELLRSWEKEGKRLPIDYMGPGFGAPAHRIRSAGHDLLRLREAARQIRDGEFRGVRWVDGRQEAVSVSGQFRDDIDTLPQAVVVLLKHLAADFVTPMGLPMPGASILYNLNSETLNGLVLQAYRGTDVSAGNGLNLRTGILSASLPVICTEVLIHLHVHNTAYQATGTLSLDSAQKDLRDELLLAAHLMTTAAATGKTIARGLLLEPHQRGAAARHLNLPALIRTACAAADVIADTRARHRACAPSWQDLLDQLDRV